MDKNTNLPSRLREIASGPYAWSRYNEATLEDAAKWIEGVLGNPETDKKRLERIKDSHYDLAANADDDRDRLLTDLNWLADKLTLAFVDVKMWRTNSDALQNQVDDLKTRESKGRETGPFGCEGCHQPPAAKHLFGCPLFNAVDVMKAADG